MLKTTTFLINAKTLLKVIGNSHFLTPKAKLAFFQLRQAFIKAFIRHHFDPERYIWIETDDFGYVIGSILSQLTPKSG